MILALGTGSGGGDKIMKLGLYFLVFGSILGLLFGPKMGLYGVHYFSIWVHLNNCEQCRWFL